MFTSKPSLNLKKIAAGVALVAATAGLGGCYYGPAYGPRYAYARPAYAAPAYDYGAGYYAPAPATAMPRMAAAYPCRSAAAVIATTAGKPSRNDPDDPKFRATRNLRRNPMVWLSEGV